MKSNKGFTLIELLAVIVILAIIALIATPIILGVIETARKGSVESSALGYIDAVEKQVLINQVAGGTEIGYPNETAYTMTVLNGFGITVKGDAPKVASVTLDADGSVATTSTFGIESQGTCYAVAYNAEKKKWEATKDTTACGTVSP